MTAFSSQDPVREAILQVLHQFAPEVDLERLPENEILRDQLDIDSIDSLRILVQLHQKLGVSVPESDYSRIQTLKTMTEYFSEKMRERASAHP